MTGAEHKSDYELPKDIPYIGWVMGSENIVNTFEI